MDLQNLPDGSRIIGHLNALLKNVDSLSRILPLSMSQAYEALRSGEIFCELVNFLVPSTIIMGKVHRDFRSETRRYFLMLENQTIAWRAAKCLGCPLTNIGPSDLADGRCNLLLSFTWQVIRYGILGRLRAKPQFKSVKIFDILEADLNSSGSDQLFAGLVDVLIESGASYEAIDWLRQSVDREEMAERIVALGNAMIGDLCLITPQDILKNNQDMITVFAASLLDQYFCTDHNDDDDDQSVPDSATELEQVVPQSTSPIQTVHFRKDRLQSEPQIDQVKLAKHLRDTYNAATRIVKVAEIIYGNLTLGNVMGKASLIGTVRIKDPKGCRWKYRKVVILDNLLLIYKKRPKETSGPRKVYRLDDSTVRNLHETAYCGDPIIRIHSQSISSKSQYIYIAPTQSEAGIWIERLLRAANFWVLPINPIIFQSVANR